MGSGRSPISSRNRVPFSALSIRPLRCAWAPVKEPFSCPKSSLSRRFSGMALQLIAMKGPFFRKTAPVNRLRRHLLSGAAFAKQQHRGAGRRHFANRGEHFLHLRARADNAFKGFRR